jgi:hypothetical protein
VLDDLNICNFLPCGLNNIIKLESLQFSLRMPTTPPPPFFKYKLAVYHGPCVVLLRSKMASLSGHS